MSANWRKNGLVYLLIVVAVAVLFYSASQSTERLPEKGLTEVAALIQSGKVARITVDGDQLELQTTDKQVFTSRKEPGVNLTTSLTKLGVTPEALAKLELKVVAPSDMGGWLTILGTVLPLLLIGGLFVMILRQAHFT